MTNPTPQPSERAATVADLRSGMIARIPRPKGGLTRPGRDADGDTMRATPPVRVLSDPFECGLGNCNCLVVYVREPDGTDHPRHLLPGRPVTIQDTPQ